MSRLVGVYLVDKGQLGWERGRVQAVFSLHISGPSYLWAGRGDALWEA